MKNHAKSRIAFSLLFVLLFISTARSASDHCVLNEVSLQQRVASSSLIIEGEILYKESYWNVAHNMIYTAHHVKVYKVFKGSPVTEVTVVTIGGQVGLDLINVTSNNHFETGEQAILFLQATQMPAKPGSNRTALYEIYAGPQGSIDYDLVEKSAQGPFDKYPSIQNGLYSDLQSLSGQSYNAVAINKKLTAVSNGINGIQAVPTITNFSPTTVTAGTRTLLTITGTNFGATRGTGFVEFRNANNGGSTYIQAKASDYRVWNNTQIQVWVPGAGTTGTPAGTGTIRVTNSDPNSVTSAGTLTISYSKTVADVGGVSIFSEHVNDNTTGGYTFQFESSTFASNAPAVASFMRAFDTWRCNTSMNWVIGSNTATNATTQDNLNVVRFDIGAELPAGVGGRCVSYLSGCSVAGGDTVVKVTEIDVIIDDGAGGFAWQYGPANPTAAEVDFETIIVHELGHGMQIGHVIAPGTVMHYQQLTGQTARILGANDIAAGLNAMGHATTLHSCKFSGEQVVAVDNSGSISIASNAPLNTVCSGASVTFTATSSVPSGTAVYQWKRNGLNVGSGGTTFITTAVNHNDNFTCVMTVTGGCNAVKTSNTVTMSVGTAPVISFTGVGEMCSGSNTSITLNSTVAGTVFTWTASSPMTNISGASSCASSCGNTISQVLTATTGTAGAVQYTLSGTANGCTSSTNPVFTKTIKGNSPAPTVSTTDGQLCVGESTTISANGAIVSPVGFTGVFHNPSWTTSILPTTSGGSVDTTQSPSSVIITGGNAGSSNEGRVLYSHPITAPGNVTFYWEYSTDDSGPNYDPAICRVNGVETILPGFNTSGATSQSGTATIPVAAGFPFEIGIWTTDGCCGAATLKITFFSAPLPAPSIDWYISPSTFLINVPNNSNHPVSPAATTNYIAFSSGGSCPATASSLLPITINPIPTGTVNSQIICSGATTNIQYTTGVPLSGITWTTSAVSGLTGNSSCSSSCGLTIAQTLHNTTTTGKTIQYVVTATSNNGCTATQTAGVQIQAPVELPGSPTASPNDVCLGQQVNVVATSSIQLMGFRHQNAPALWTTTFSGGSPGGSASATSTALTMVSGNNGVGGYVDFSRGVISASGFLSFKYDYTTVDNSSYDYPRLLINGVEQIFTGFVSGINTPQSGTMSVPVTAGQSVGFRMWTTDGVFGSATVVISELDMPVSGNIQWYSAASGGTPLTVSASGSSVTVTPATVGSFSVFAQAIDFNTGCTNTSRKQTNIINVLGQPVINTVSPTSGTPGTLVTILGSNLASAASITFNGVPATPVTNTNTQITVNVPAGASTGQLQVSTACGNASIAFTVPSTSVTFNLKLFLQGFYTGGQTMTSALFNGGVGTNPNIADSVIVELHSSVAPYGIVHFRTVAVAFNGQSSMTFPSSVLGQSYYVVIRHRNSLETWSKNPITFASTTSFDFSAP